MSEVRLPQFIRVRNAVTQDVVDARLEGLPGARLALQALIALSLKPISLKGKEYASVAHCVQEYAIDALNEIYPGKWTNDFKEAHDLLVRSSSVYV